MGYLNEYPHWDANDLNLDWLLEQYSTFNERLQELHNHFDEAVERMESDIENFETEVNGTLTSFNTYMTTELNQIRTDFNSYVTTVNERFDELSEDIQEQTTGAIEDIQRQIDTISNNMITYINEHMSEWQAEASFNNNTLKLSNETSPVSSSDTVKYIQVDGELHNIYHNTDIASTTLSFFNIDSVNFVSVDNSLPATFNDNRLSFGVIDIKIGFVNSANHYIKVNPDSYYLWNDSGVLKLSVSHTFPNIPVGGTVIIYVNLIYDSQHL